jgi:3-oxoacyl-[acyl-carrier protein] reductase
MNSAFKDQVVIVTGGSRGIGAAVVTRFAALGATVYFSYLENEEAARALATATGAQQIKCAQADGQAINDTVARITQQHQRLDVLVNNAGVNGDQFLMLMPPADWDRVLDTNLNGAFRWSKAVCRPMLAARRGVIINIASISGLMGVPGQTNYSASKGGLIAFGRSLAAELGPRGIRVNTVVPGFIETDMIARIPPEVRQQNIQHTPLRRIGQPADVATVVAFLASADAAFITGQTVVVDGGLTSSAA